MSDLRERLLGKKRPTLDHPVQVAEDTSAEERAVTKAEQALRLARLAEDDEKSPAVRKAEKAAEKARSALEACYVRVPLRALPPEDFEAMVDSHGEGKEDGPWADLAFQRAVTLECLPKDLSREEWESWMDTACSDGERRGLYLSAVDVNARVPSPSVPKG